MIDEKKLIETLSKNSIFEKITNAEGKNIFEIIDDIPKTEWIPCKVKDIIDTIISHNEIVALWVEEEAEDVRYDKQIWRGMAWDIPNSYKGCRFVKIFGTVPESIAEADTINIRIEIPQPYKKEGAENEM